MKKDEIAEYITQKLHVENVQFSRGSTEPKELLLQIAEAIGLPISQRLSKPEIAKLIVESSGAIWHPIYESSGSTITKQGMYALKEAIDFFFGSINNSQR